MPVNWELIQGLEGEIVRTPTGKPLRVAGVSGSQVWLDEERNGEWCRQPTPVPRDEVDRHWDDLLEIGHLCKGYFERRGMNYERGGDAQRARPRAIFALLCSVYPEQVQAYRSGDPCNARWSGIRLVSQ